MFVVARANPWPPALSAFSVRKALLNVRLFSLQKEKLIIFLTLFHHQYFLTLLLCSPAEVWLKDADQQKGGAVPLFLPQPSHQMPWKTFQQHPHQRQSNKGQLRVQEQLGCSLLCTQISLTSPQLQLHLSFQECHAILNELQHKPNGNKVAYQFWYPLN